VAEFANTKKMVMTPAAENEGPVEEVQPPLKEDPKISFIDKLKVMFTSMLEIEDQSITTNNDEKKNNK
jgi:hypothetical protein